MLQEAVRVNLPHSVCQNWRALRQRAVQTAQLNPDIPNYIVIPWINKVIDGEDKIDHQAETQAAEVIFHAFPGINPDYILAIANSGVSFGKAVSKFYPNTQFLEAEKLEKSEESEEWDSGFKYVTAHSYSRNKDFQFKIPKIPPGKKVLIIDDVAAYAGVGKPIAKALQETGAEVVGYGVYFDKVFQEGLSKISHELGILCFSVIRISEIMQSGIKLLNEESSLKLI